MSFSAKKFLQQYGVAGVLAYGGVTAASVTSIYAVLRSGVDIIVPIETCLGSDSELVQNLKAKLGDTPSLEDGNKNEGTAGLQRKPINWAREATYFGIAGALDSFALPLKLMVCLPLARQLTQIRGRGGR